MTNFFICQYLWVVRVDKNASLYLLNKQQQQQQAFELSRVRVKYFPLVYQRNIKRICYSYKGVPLKLCLLISVLFQSDLFQ